ncbi:hypothetical protein [Planococcus glaciei]|nr:hypothetical protein [Planococcus glaciei]
MAENIVIEAEPVKLPDGIGSESHQTLCTTLKANRNYPNLGT